MCIDSRRFIYTSATPARKLIKRPGARVDLTIRRPCAAARPAPPSLAAAQEWAATAYKAALASMGRDRAVVETSI